METIGQRIRRVRKAQGLTQVQLAKQAGVDQSTLSDIENGAKFGADVLMSLADCLLKTPQYLMRGEEAAGIELADEEVAMVKAYRQVRPAKAKLSVAASAPVDEGAVKGAADMNTKAKQARKGEGRERNQN